MKRVFKQLAFIPLVLLGLVIGISSCGKKDPAKAEITVVDENDERIEGATVNIICTPIEKSKCKEGTEQDGITNSSGKVEFEWEHPAIYGSKNVGFAVLKVEAYKDSSGIFCFNSVDSLGQDTIICFDSTFQKFGSTFIELQIEKTAKETITIVQE
ncbi:MAG: hypothetical protein JKY53_09505 [Flavobacteriales bacterium]|nr:hypothetical protein [Flavobacteriales bacterium]